MERRTFKATINRAASEVQTKATGTYVLHTAIITEEGPLKGKTVTCSRTLTNKKGEEKKGVEVDQKVVLHMEVVENAEGKKKPFFEIQAGVIAAEDAEILLALGIQSI